MVVLEFFKASLCKFELSLQRPRPGNCVCMVCLEAMHGILAFQQLGLQGLHPPRPVFKLRAQHGQVPKGVETLSATSRQHVTEAGDDPGGRRQQCIEFFSRRRDVAQR